MQSLFFVAPTGTGKSSLGLSFFRTHKKDHLQTKNNQLFNFSGTQCNVVHISALRGSEVFKYDLFERMQMLWNRTSYTELVARDPKDANNLSPIEICIETQVGRFHPINVWSDGKESAFCALYLVMRPENAPNHPHLFIVDEPESHIELGTAVPFWAALLSYQSMSLFVFFDAKS